VVLLVPVVLCVGAVVLLGRTFAPLTELRLRAAWAAAAALGIQVVVLGLLPDGSRPLHAVLHVLTYALAGWFVFSNRTIVGVPLLAAGGALNVIAIVANGGVMPASRTAMAAARMHPTSGFQNSAVVDHPHLLFLGDVIPVPAPGPLRNVLSVGDFVLLAGAVMLVLRCSSPRAARTV
jgi:Family of unknown function (DUF5317)